LVVSRWFTVRSKPGIVQVPLGRLIMERHCQMNQADAGRIGANDMLSYQGFRLGLANARSELLDLAARTGSLRGGGLVDLGVKCVGLDLPCLRLFCAGRKPLHFLSDPTRF
jgi:hypothetical protein